MFDIKDNPHYQRVHAKYVRYIMENFSDHYLAYVKHAKALKNLLGTHGYAIIQDEVLSVEFEGGIIRFPVPSQRRNRVLNLNGVKYTLPDRPTENGYYDIHPEKLRFEERMIDDPGRYRLNINKPTFSKDHLTFCTEIDLDVLLELREVARKASYNGEGVFFAATRAYFGKESVSHRWNLGKHVGFEGEKLENVVQHMIRAYVPDLDETDYKEGITWKVWRTKEDEGMYTYEPTQYIFICGRPRNPWNNCVVMEADYLGNDF